VVVASQIRPVERSKKLILNECGLYGLMEVESFEVGSFAPCICWLTSWQLALAPGWRSCRQRHTASSTSIACFRGWRRRATIGGAPFWQLELIERPDGADGEMKKIPTSIHS
jgi:hypothetical protein